MKHFSASEFPNNAALNTRNFVKEHNDAFLDLLKKIGPYIFAVFVLNIILLDHSLSTMTDVIESSKNEGLDQEQAAEKMMNELEGQEFATTAGFIIINVLFGYFFAVIAISWHRLVLLGRGNCTPMNPLSPQRHEIEFLIILAILSSAPYLLNLLVMFGQVTAMAILLLPFMIAFIYVFYKVSFMFPAKAVNAKLSVKESFQLTKGYFWKMLWTYILASWRVVLVLFAVMIVGSMVAVPLATFSGGNTQLVVISMQLIYIPVIIYFQPLLTVIGVTVLSNYYQHALQNKNIPEKT